MTLRRLDAELVRRSLARSREQARELIESGSVIVRGTVATKAATQVQDGDSIVVASEAAIDGYVSRGAHKLIGALDAFPGIDVQGRHCLDAGASTGGFTQVLLERGASDVMAVDVGYGQLAWSLRTDDRVDVIERTNVRTLDPALLPRHPDLIVADLSFISLALVLPAMRACATSDCDYVLMVKPQFEVGRESVGDGVVREPALRIDAVRSIADVARQLGLTVHGVAASPLPGPSGNVEYFLWLSARVIGGSDNPEQVLAMIERAVEEGPR